jgi:esterase FrsA
MYQPKTLSQIKGDLGKLVVAQSHPMEMTQKRDVEQACAMLKNVDSDHWCEVWSQVAKPYEEKAQEEEKLGRRREAKEDYLLAYNYYRMARFTVPNTPAKMRAYRSSVENYIKASRYFDPPLERVVIPFPGKKGEGKEIPVYVRKPVGVECPPVLINHAGVDVFKEEQCLVEKDFLDRGLATLSMDMPGTGEAPILGTGNAERLYDPILRYVQERSDLDGSRIGLLGMSFGGYWSTKVAHIELDRLRAVVSWGGGAHYNFQREWQFKCRYAPTHLGNEDLIVTRSNSFGIYDFEEWLEYVPSISLLDKGILDGPSVPMLLVNGKDDVQAPIDDLYLLLQHGQPKAARVFPGGHMGMTPQTLPTVADWISRKLEKR